MRILSIRKLADTSEGERVRRFDPETGRAMLVNPKTGAEEPWPLAGIKIEGEVPQQTSVSTGWVAQGKSEGWISVEGERVEHAPAGPPEEPWRKTHTFVQYDFVTLHTVDGVIRYQVVANPGKYQDPNEASGYRVDHFYTLERVS